MPPAATRLMADRFVVGTRRCEKARTFLGRSRCRIRDEVFDPLRARIHLGLISARFCHGDGSRSKIPEKCQGNPVSAPTYNSGHPVARCSDTLGTNARPDEGSVCNKDQRGVNGFPGLITDTAFSRRQERSGSGDRCTRWPKQLCGIRTERNSRRSLRQPSLEDLANHLEPGW